MSAASRPWMVLSLLAALLFFAAASSSAQTFSVIHDINCATDGCGDQQPIPMTQARDGDLYGQMYSGGQNGYGTAWKVTPTGTFDILWDFTFPASNNAFGGLTLALDGNFYGVDPFGGTNNVGYVFKLTPTGTFSIVYSFNNNTDGGYTGEPLTLGPDGNLYGLDGYNCYFYKITVSTGAFSIVTKNCPQGGYYGLTLGADGKFYGVTFNGGANNKGSVFNMTTAGKITTLHSFTGTDGQNPVGLLVQASDGNLYGVTSETSASSDTGVLYKISPSGTFAVVHTFNPDGSEGTNFAAGLVVATDGNLYGVTQNGGATNGGTLFMSSRTGSVFNVVHSFDCSTDGCNNWVPLAQRTDGTLYGVSMQGGTFNNGTIYKLTSPTFLPFVLVQNFEAPSPRTIDILGTGLSGATAVDFGSIPATSFKVVSDTFMTAVVPPDAISALVTVKTPTATLSTLKKLVVPPTVTGFTPTSGSVGTVVTISGTSFTGATKVTFGGVKATTFTVNSPIQITATVPTGAVTGAIAVTTPSGTGSKKTFTVD
jgi:uncharacterized repeat protein (TIGR03803 family)